MAEQIAPASDTPHPAPHRGRARLFWLCFGIFAAPLAWNLQLLIGSAVSGHVCYPALEPVGPQAGSGLGWLFTSVDLAGIAVALLALGVSVVHWRRLRQEKAGSGHHLLDQGEGRTRFMAMLGILNSLLFLVALLFASANQWFFPLCP